MAELRPRLAEFEKAGSQVAVIGTGWPAAAKGFAEKSGLPGSIPILVDRDRRSFSLLGLRRSFFATLFSLRLLRNFLRLRREGFKQGRIQGDPWQQGGAAVVATSSEVVYRYASAAPDDALPIDAVLAAAREAGAPRTPRT
ncbi:MAG TPA: peroxiredoxin-like family protein [Myxococcales bacterium]|nr:peroxiredoxin-like family protein [Myxococcales bacterium]